MVKKGALISGDFLIVLGAMLVLAGFLTLLTSKSFGINLLYSVSIGLSCYAVTKLVLNKTGKCYPDWKVALFAIPVGTFLGIVIANGVSGLSFMHIVDSHPRFIVSTLVISVITGSLLLYYFYTRGVIAEAELNLKQKTIEKMLDEQMLAESELRLLQAQIEPHFLFNTLSNILSLIHDQPQKAEKMLENLSDCLRASLQQTRASRITIREELDLVRAYLEIQKVRMEDRLVFRIEADTELLELEIPPLLVQPLVENAIKHGLEPKKEGGMVTVRVHPSSTLAMMEISVTDDGVGFSGSGSEGLGISNTVQRLKATYKTKASIHLLANVPQGMKVMIEIPRQFPETA